MRTGNNDADIAVKLVNVKKRYILGQIGGRTLQADLQSWWARKRGKEDPNSRIGESTRLQGQAFMALNGIDLTIYKGEALGIIGSNGAGKSTMLKLLARVTAPTEGEIDIYGRITSMLEVGTGFNGEMTGRENIYMNGAILGMTKAEIDAKMEDIINFSEVRDFIDTPVKRYSSGMYVKLAFSVAAHLDSEIMIMDEVLAVGDVAFQNKCLAKMRSVATEEGRTVLYVSHNMNTIRSLCTRCIVLDQGKIVFDGDVEEAISVYTHSKNAVIDTFYNLKDNPYRFSDSTFIEDVSLSDSVVKQGSQIEFTLSINSKQDIEKACFRSIITSMSGDAIGMLPSDLFSIKKGIHKYRFMWNTSQLAPESYYIDLVLLEVRQEDYIKLDQVVQTVAFSIDSAVNYYNQGWQKRYWGSVLLNDLRYIPK